ncbi:MAG: 16S rRNA (guanine(527)-N(7))-methyltransferase RsmG [Rhizobiales bacterium]|nr:16S rRNA (guanine(527)-N(7))-methyltransferase RsmG [Hyphomicrobiales bacterium]
MSGPTPPADMLSRFNVSRESLDNLRIYVDLLLKWQKRINLIGPSTTSVVWQRHIADALMLADIVPANARVMIDLGSGAGIPGLVFAIAYGHERGFEMHLVESNGKKAAFLREAVRLTGVAAHVHNKRAQDLAAEIAAMGPDVVLARALAPLENLLGLAEPYLAAGAIGLFHKGQDVDTELTAATKYWNINARKHMICADSVSCILEIREISRVARL